MRFLIRILKVETPIGGCQKELPKPYRGGPFDAALMSALLILYSAYWERKKTVRTENTVQKAAVVAIAN